MTAPKYNTKARHILELHHRWPDLTSPDLAVIVDCHPAYVRKAIARAGGRLGSNGRRRVYLARTA